MPEVAGAVAVETGGAAALGGRVLFAEGLSTVIAFGVGLEVGCGEGLGGGTFRLMMERY